MRRRQRERATRQRARAFAAWRLDDAPCMNLKLFGPPQYSAARTSLFRHLALTMEATMRNRKPKRADSTDYLKHWKTESKDHDDDDAASRKVRQEHYNELANE